MKSILLKILFIFAAVLIITNCSELEKDLGTENDEVNIHPEGFLTYSSPNYHAKAIKNANWNLGECMTCHASDFSGGTSGFSCLKCHSGERGPLECNTCHGDFHDESHIAPPKDLNNNDDIASPGVGLHELHMYNNTMGADMGCRTCHNNKVTIPEGGSFALAHIDGIPAEMTFGNMAIEGGAEPGYSFDTRSCDNVYCHGNFEFVRDSADASVQWVYDAEDGIMRGNNLQVIWNMASSSKAMKAMLDGMAEESCTTCHDMPPKGHRNIPNCNSCHGSVVDENLNIIDKTKHINGYINYMDEEYKH